MIRKNIPDEVLCCVVGVRGGRATAPSLTEMPVRIGVFLFEVRCKPSGGTLSAASFSYDLSLSNELLPSNEPLLSGESSSSYEVSFSIEAKISSRVVS